MRWYGAMSIVLGLAAGSLGAQQSPKPQPISFDQLTAYDYELPGPLAAVTKETQAQMPGSIRALNGKRVQISGFMLPIDLEADGVRQFILNGSLDMCYFGAPVRINDWIMVTMSQGKKAQFSHMPTRITGTLEVGEEIRNGRIVSLYRLKADEASISR